MVVVAEINAGETLPADTSSFSGGLFRSLRAVRGDQAEAPPQPQLLPGVQCNSFLAMTCSVARDDYILPQAGTTLESPGDCPEGPSTWNFDPPCVALLAEALNTQN